MSATGQEAARPLSAARTRTPAAAQSARRCAAIPSAPADSAGACQPPASHPAIRAQTAQWQCIDPIQLELTARFKQVLWTRDLSASEVLCQPHPDDAGPREGAATKASGRPLQQPPDGRVVQQPVLCIQPAAWETQPCSDLPLQQHPQGIKWLRQRAPVLLEVDDDALSYLHLPACCKTVCWKHGAVPLVSLRTYLDVAVVFSRTQRSAYERREPANMHHKEGWQSLRSCRATHIEGCVHVGLAEVLQLRRFCHLGTGVIHLDSPVPDDACGLTYLPCTLQHLCCAVFLQTSCMLGDHKLHCVTVRSAQSLRTGMGCGSVSRCSATCFVLLPIPADAR